MLPDVTGYVAAAVGGVLGALGRWAVGEALPSPTWPLATLLVNLTGCLLIGVLMAVLAVRVPAPRPWLRPFLATGLLGGWTTYSALAMEVVLLVGAGDRAVAAGYVLVCVAGGVLAVATGLRLARAAVGRPAPGAGDRR